MRLRSRRFLTAYSGDVVQVMQVVVHQIAAEAEHGERRAVAAFAGAVPEVRRHRLEHVTEPIRGA